jgi:hypothetical protein
MRRGGAQTPTPLSLPCGSTGPPQLQDCQVQAKVLHVLQSSTWRASAHVAMSACRVASRRTKKFV